MRGMGKRLKSALAVFLSAAVLLGAADFEALASALQGTTQNAEEQTAAENAGESGGG